MSRHITIKNKKTGKRLRVYKHKERAVWVDAFNYRTEYNKEEYVQV